MPSAARGNAHHNDRAAQFNGGGGTALRAQQYFAAQSRIRSVYVSTIDAAAAVDHPARAHISAQLMRHKLMIPPNGLKLSP
jgi:hypothetical protein